MTIIDARRLSVGSNVDTSVCIIGAGAAGITIAGALESSGHKVCLLEAGDFRPDEVTQDLHSLESVGYPVRENYMSRARYFGGTCNIWAGRVMRLRPFDLRARPWVHRSGWPLAYDELAKFYPQAERNLGIPRDLHKIQDVGDPNRFAQEAALFDADDLEYNLALWAKKPMRFGAAYKRRLARSTGVDVYLNASAVELTLNADGSSLERVEALTLNGVKLSIRARYLVLAAGGLENARLLLASRQQHHNGIGNAFDLVGRFYMDHPRVVFGQVELSEPRSLPLLLGAPVKGGKIQLGIAMTEAVQAREGLLNSYISLEPRMSAVVEQQYQASVNFMKVLLRMGYAGKRRDYKRAGLTEIRDMIYLLTPKEIMPHAVFRAYATLKHILRRDRLRELTIVNYCEQAPNFHSRVYLSENKDRLGMNTLVLDWKIGSAEVESLRRVHEMLDARLRRLGLGRLTTRPGDLGTQQFTDASHHMGTTRMSGNAADGVVDENCRVHGVENLYIGGSSVFPTVGNANPTLTIVALALRTADHLRQLLRQPR